MMETILLSLFIAVQVLVGYNLVLPLILYIAYQLKVKNRQEPAAVAKNGYDYAVIVTAYEQTDCVPAAVESLLKMNYDNFMVYLVADKCDVTNLRFDDPRVVVLRPAETLASNTRSHFYAIKNFVRDHDVLTIIDSDNLAHPEYLTELSRCFDEGYHAVQGTRKAKNLNTTYACLDAARDIYYHFYDGEVLFQVGSSATLAGSGMAFKTSLYRECLERLDVSGAGFDKVLQKEIVSRGYRIAFNEHAVVYDEKTSASDQLVKQRARWINTWFRYCKFGVNLLADGIAGSNLNKFVFGLTLLRPPLFIFLLLSGLFFIINIFFSGIAALLWLGGMSAFVASFAIAFLRSKPDKRIVNALSGVPRFMYYQVRSLLLMRRANQISVATKHYNNATIADVDDELKGTTI